jgi:hypothetical protein
VIEKMSADDKPGIQVDWTAFREEGRRIYGRLYKQDPIVTAG